MIKFFNRFRKRPTLKQADFVSGKKLCTTCGTSSNLSATFCPKCGEDGFFRTYYEYLETTYKYCSKCEKKITGGEKFCTACGCSHFVSYYTLQARRESAAKKPQRMKILKIISIVLSILIAVGLLIFGIWGQVFCEGSWPGLLIMFMVIGTVMTVLLLLDVLVIEPEEGDCFCVYGSLVIAIIGAIVGFIFLFFQSLAIWAFGIFIPLTVSGLSGFLTSLKKYGMDDGVTIIYLVMLAVCAILLIASILTISWGYGWGLYFV